MASSFIKFYDRVSIWSLPKFWFWSNECYTRHISYLPYGSYWQAKPYCNIHILIIIISFIINRYSEISHFRGPYYLPQTSTKRIPGTNHCRSHN